MFTGIIEAIGKIEAVEVFDNDMRLVFSCGDMKLAVLENGDSIAINGVCLTITDLSTGKITVDVSGETLSCTTLSAIQCGQLVNLERSLLPTTPLGGHFVSGHVDGIGIINSIVHEGRSLRLRIAVPELLAKYIAPKGSICVDGVSLTVNHVEGNEFEVNIIPHTLTATILGEYMSGSQVNIEVDIIARYLERLLNAGYNQEKPVSTLTRSFLAEHGYIKKQDTN